MCIVFSAHYLSPCSSNEASFFRDVFIISLCTIEKQFSSVRSDSSLVVSTLSRCDFPPYSGGSFHTELFELFHVSLQREHLPKSLSARHGHRPLHSGHSCGPRCLIPVVSSMVPRVFRMIHLKPQFIFLLWFHLGRGWGFASEWVRCFYPAPQSTVSIMIPYCCLFCVFHWSTRYILFNGRCHVRVRTLPPQPLRCGARAGASTANASGRQIKWYCGGSLFFVISSRPHLGEQIMLVKKQKQTYIFLILCEANEGF